MAKDSIIDINKILTNYTEEIKDSLEKTIIDVANEGADILKNTKDTYHVKTGKYNKSWSVKKNVGTNFIQATIYNKEYSLTHLLEDGHATRNGKRTRAYKHIEPVDKYVTEKVTKEFEKIIERGGK